MPPNGFPYARARGKAFISSRMPGQTYDDVIRELIRTNSETRLIEETERICKRGHFVEYKR